MAQETGVIYRNRDITVSYDREEDRFTYQDRKSTKFYERFRYNDLILEKFSNIPREDRGELEKRLIQIKDTYAISAPAPEEILKSSLYEMAKINESENHDCGPSPISMGEESPDFIVDIEMPKLDEKRDGLLGLGELEGMELEINSNNDNPLHGGLMATGLTNFRETDGIEGDDRGLTVGFKYSGKLKFENGEVLLSYGSKAYTKLVAKPCGTTSISGATYQQLCYQNSDGTWNQEGLNKDDYDIKVLRKIGDDKKSYVQFGAGVTVKDDKGFALATQEKWHKAFKGVGTIQYRNYEHMDRAIIPRANFKIGRITNLTDPDKKVSLSSNVYAGAQISYLGGNGNYVSYGGSLNIKINDKDKNIKFPAMETRFYYDGQYTAKDEVNHKYGVETRANFFRKGTSSVYLKVGVGVEDDTSSRAYELYGKSPISDNLDLQHYIGIGFAKKF